MSPNDERVILIDGCIDPHEVAAVLDACRRVPGVVIVGVDVARDRDLSVAVLARHLGPGVVDILDVVTLKLPVIDQGPELVPVKLPTPPKPVAHLPRFVRNTNARIAGADIRRFLPRRR